MDAINDVLDGRYRLTDRLGAGGMGEVYRAQRIRLGDEVAVKFIRSDFCDQPRSRERFMSEARACAALRHPNIVSVLDFGVDPARGPFLVMEYLNGESLAQQIAASGPIDAAAARAILADLAAALDLAHSIGLIHRDLKPSNVVTHRYGSGEVVYKIIDFGIGLLKPAGTASSATHDPVLGTMRYAAPEQLMGEAVDHRADVYSLGALVFEMLTGRCPFEGHDLHALLAQVMFASPSKPSALRPDLTAQVDEAVLRALAKDPHARWPNATAFARAFGANPAPLRAPDAHPASPFRERYELGERLATGRLGSDVYAARHRAIGHDVVIRILRRTIGEAWERGRARFLREAQAMQIAHPSLLQVRDFGEEPDFVYIVTDRVAGSSLREVIDADTRLLWPRARRLIAHLLSAGRALHRRGGLFYGMTPAILRVATDDGEERLVVSSAGVTELQDVLAGASAETLRALRIPNSDLLYVAPEVLMGEEPDGRTDVYTVGVIGYEMLTGCPPFEALTVPQLLGRIFSAEFADPRQHAPEIPVGAVDIIGRCLAHRPDRRFADLDELHAAWLQTAEAAS